MSFPGISRVLNGFKERVRTQTFFGHPKKKTKAENPTQNKTKKKGGGAIGVRKPCLSYSNGVVSGGGAGKKNQQWEKTGRSLQEEEDFPALPRRGGAAGSPSPSRGIAPGARGWHRSWLRRRPGGWVGWFWGSVEMNSFLSQNTLNRRDGTGKGVGED